MTVQTRPDDASADPPMHNGDAGAESYGAESYGAGSHEPRWLTDVEMAAWLPFVEVINLLPQRLDQQLRSEAGISHIYFAILVRLSAAPDQTIGMGDLARLTFTSPSRCTHAVASLEKRGWVARRRDPDNGRVQNATLTTEGVTVLERIAPGHVAEVRRRVFDRLSPEQVAQLQDIADTLNAP